MHSMTEDLKTENKVILNHLNENANEYGNKIEALENRMEHFEKMIEKIARKLDNTVLVEMVAKN